MSGASSGAAQGMLPPTVEWIVSGKGFPTPAFYALILSLLNRTGGTSAPSGPGGQIGLTYLQEQINGLDATAQLALGLGTIGLMMDDDGAVEPVVANSNSDSDNFAIMGDDGVWAPAEQGQFAAALAAIGDEGLAPGPDQAALLALLLGDSNEVSSSASPATPSIYAPLVNGDLPGPTFVADPYGQCIMVPIT